MPLTNEQYNSIIRIFDEKQLRARRELEERRTKAFTEIPRLREIDGEIASLALRSARERVGGGTPTVDLDGRIADLAEERRALLAVKGYPPDHLEEHYECPDCRDTGFAGGEKCVCFRREELRLIFSESNLSEKAKSETFSAFSLAHYRNDDAPQGGISSRAWAEDGLRKARSFADSFGSQFSNLFIHGGTGVGKTFLSNCIANRVMERGHSVLYLSSFDLFDRMIGSSFSRETGRAEELIFSSELLIIDDLGAELTNALESEKLFLCLNTRLTGRRPTVISSNLELPELRKRYSERVCSRIIGNYGNIPLFGNDIRQNV